METSTTKDELKNKVSTILDENRGNKGALITILQQIQELYGYVPSEYIGDTALALGIFPSQIYGVLTFYSQFRLEPIGENIIRVCHGTACHVRGADLVLDTICQELDVNEGETTKDNKYTVEKVFCVGSCSLAPVIRINEETYGRLSEKETRKALKNFEQDGHLKRD